MYKWTIYGGYGNCLYYANQYNRVWFTFNAICIRVERYNTRGNFINLITIIDRNNRSIEECKQMCEHYRKKKEWPKN